MAKPIEIPASEVREQISDVISRVAFGGKRVVISRNGKVQAAIVPLEDLERLQKLDAENEERLRRFDEALERIRARAEANGVADMTDEEIDAEIEAVRKERRAKQGGR